MMMFTQSIYKVISGTAFHGLMDLCRIAVEPVADDELQGALEDWGDQTGETFLHLLGLCLNLDEPHRFQELVAFLEAIDPDELRLTILGMTAWSWKTIVGADTIARAAAGEEAAMDRLLADDRYYAGVAGPALGKILPLSSADTKARLLAVLNTYGERVDIERQSDALRSVVDLVSDRAALHGWEDTIEDLTGFRYHREPEARHVVVIPHLADESLSLVQHDETRLIVFGASGPKGVESTAVDIGRALGDLSRIELLRDLTKGSRQLGDLMEVTGLARSTVHHHLRILRDVGLISVSGNARAYRYSLSDPGRLRALVALRSVLGLDQKGTEHE